MQNYFRIGELAKLYGISVDSLRYYEKIGILHPQRSETGYRHYDLQDIWKLNIIRDLRALGFDMERIRVYLEHHSVSTTLQLLEEEKTAIADRIRYLEGLRRNVEQRVERIQAAEEGPLEQIVLKSCPDRHYFGIREGYDNEYEMDVLIKRLMNKDKERLYVIGSNQMGTVIVPEGDGVRYESVFVFDDRGDRLLPGGNYLSVRYRGSYDKSRLWINRLRDYGASHGLKLRGKLMEILWIDIHTSANVEEYITELQILTEKEEN